MKKGLILELQFTAFEIDCKYDHLTITDADGTTLMEKSCGSIKPASITSTTNVINVLFSSYSVKLYLGDRRNDVPTGWKLNWRAVEPGECQQRISFLLSSVLLPLDDEGLEVNSLLAFLQNFKRHQKFCCFDTNGTPVTRFVSEILPTICIFRILLKILNGTERHNKSVNFALFVSKIL